MDKTLHFQRRFAPTQSPKHQVLQRFPYQPNRFGVHEQGLVWRHQIWGGFRKQASRFKTVQFLSCACFRVWGGRRNIVSSVQDVAFCEGPPTPFFCAKTAVL